MPAGNGWVPFGRIARAHGVRGEMRLVPHNAGDLLPKSVANVRIVRGGTEVRVAAVSGVRPVHDALLLRLEGVSDRDEAQKLSGCELQLASTDVPELEEGEFYLYELQGVQLKDEQGNGLGKVLRVDMLAGQDLLVIEGPDGERLLPLGPETVHSLDREAGVAVVELPEGIWDDAPES